MTRYGIRINNVSVERGNYHIVLKVFCRELDINREYIIDFIGTEVAFTDLSLSDKLLSSLNRKLLNFFGFPPYNEKRVSELVDNNRYFEI